MKTKIFTNRKVIFALFACIATTLGIFLLTLSGLTAYATFSGQSGGMTRAELHTATSAISVNSNTATITILTHGLGGDAGDWSNGMGWKAHGIGEGNWGGSKDFTYDSVSIIEKIRNATPNGIKLYRAVTSNTSSFTLYPEYEKEIANEITTITDFSQHTVIVISTSTWTEIEQSYEQLHYIIDKTSYDFYKVFGCLPKLNLIGHSLGGLINMNYAIAHPKNVASLISIGTPYNGSWYDNWFVELLGVTDFNSSAGKCITGNCGHSYYFCNLTTRRNTWNNTYTQNPHIKFHAISGETSLNLMNHIIWDDNHLETYLGTAEVVGIRALYVATFPWPLFLEFLPGDVCVDTNSQKAEGYNGAINYNKNFTTSNSNCGKRAQNNFPIPHNLETYDSDMHNYILNNTTFGVPLLTNANGDTINSVNVTLSGSISIPSVINGITITAIGSSAFANQTQLSQITIPASVKTIGANAFSGCSKLTIYAEATQKPSGWNNSWNPLSRPVYWSRCSTCKSSLSYVSQNNSSHMAECCNRTMTESHIYGEVSNCKKTCVSCGHEEESHSFSFEHYGSSTHHRAYCTSCSFVKEEKHTHLGGISGGQYVWLCPCGHSYTSPLMIAIPDEETLEEEVAA